MLRVTGTGQVQHLQPVTHHAITKPSEAQAQRALAKIIDHLTGSAKQKVDADIDTLRRFLCMPC